MAKIRFLKRLGLKFYPVTIPQAVIDPVSKKTQKAVNVEVEGHITGIALKANHGYGELPQKTLKQVDENVSQLAGGVNQKAAHGYGEAAQKTLKEVDINVEALASIVDENLGWYGIEFDEAIANSACRRIGSMEMHRQLPIQSRMKRCLLLDDGTVNYYLHDTDSTKKADGTSAVLDGTDGQVMVEMPAHWRKFENEGTVHRVKISDHNVSGFHFVKRAYRSAYESTVHRPTLKLSSVMNMSPDYRGGNNNAAWDDTYRTLLGMPATNISGTNFALYGKNRGARWCMDVYHVKKAMDWLYYIEYANFNSQLAFNPVPTAEGFKQGGLGAGVTTLTSAKWTAFNSLYPFTPAGAANNLGNKTGEVAFIMPDEYDPIPLTVYIPTYRGIEHPFGHVWKWTDGIKINIQANDAGGQSQLYVCEDPLKFQHANYVGYDMRGLLPRAEGYVKQMIMGEFGEVMPASVGGGSTTYFADYFYTSIPASGEAQRGVLFGGASNNGAIAGLALAYTPYAFAIATTHFGSRLCFIPE